MKILSTEIQTVTTETRIIKLPEGQKITYILYLNEKCKVIDEILRDETGEDIQDAELLERIQQFVG